MKHLTENISRSVISKILFCERFQRKLESWISPLHSLFDNNNNTWQCWEYFQVKQFTCKLYLAELYRTGLLSIRFSSLHISVRSWKIVAAEWQAKSPKFQGSAKASGKLFQMSHIKSCLWPFATVNFTDRRTSFLKW